MSTVERADTDNLEQMDSTSRRDFMKVAGIGALGLAYSHPIVETLNRTDRLGHDYGGGGGSSSRPGSSSSDSSGRSGSSSSSTGSNS